MTRRGHCAPAPLLAAVPPAPRVTLGPVDPRDLPPPEARSPLWTRATERDIRRVLAAGAKPAWNPDDGWLELRAPAGGFVLLRPDIAEAHGFTQKEKLVF